MEIDRILFASLERTNHGTFGTVKYFILIDGRYEDSFYADSDEEAKTIFRQKYGR